MYALAETSPCYRMAAALRSAACDLTNEESCLRALFRAGFPPHDAACLVHRAMARARESAAAIEMSRPQP